MATALPSDVAALAAYVRIIAPLVEAVAEVMGDTVRGDLRNLQRMQNVVDAHREYRDAKGKHRGRAR